MTDESMQLFERVRAMCGDPFFQKVIRGHCSFLADNVAAADLNLHIHPNDQMLWHSLKHHRDANAAFSQYYNVALQQYNAASQILRSLFPGPLERIRVLDFACGYGRLLRFLSLSLPPQQIWASEIQADALAFVCDNFRVTGIPSHVDPQAFQPDRRFHLIWVASLFSHLPARLFEAWLRRLVDCLEPDGVLCFSAHDACLLPKGTELPAEGILFKPFSENAALDTTTYGTTYVCEDFVDGVIAKVCGAGHGHFRIPRGLAHEQDLYMVPAAPDRDLSGLQSFRRGPWGWVDERELRQPGELYLRGWAASIDDGPLETVDIEVNGAHYRCPTGQRRQDVAAVFEDPRLDTAGWEFRHILAPGDARLRIIVSARTSNDESALLYAGELQRPAPPAGRGDQPVSTSRGILQRLGDLLARLRRAGSSR